jgi:serine/threonine protein kinase
LPLSRLREWKDLDRFEKEAAMLGALDHPGIPASMASFLVNDEAGATFYLVQEWVEGETLKSLLQRTGAFDEERTRALLIELLEILVYLHSRNPPIIHRDIKPSNVIIRPAGRAILIDFGAGREAIEDSGSSTVGGTFGYMPPEQLRGRPVPASDLYALGATICQALCGKEPSDMPSGSAVFEIDFRPWCDVSDGFAAVLENMLRQDTQRRFRTAREVLASLDEADVPGTPLVPAPRFDEDVLPEDPAPASASTAMVRRETGASAALYSFYDLAEGWRYLLPALGVLFLLPPVTPIGVVLLLCGAYVSASNIREGYYNHELLSRGAIQPATVHEIEIEGGRVKLVYAYTVHRQTYRAEIHLPHHCTAQLRVGASIQIAVDPYLPEDSVPLLGRMRGFVK